ncbi:MAG: nuclear transport factor 2 family protein [Desulfomonile tiedjei]|uniref:Nuclear transport factor 2 family protein n=1 Tax=Desulfomonile tiedjei TaxID=2358 RepID=A0A9D6Z2H2_9BACT|nr:nuclear transport factor 2 family protein [Desulfomonile tiedjei]
MKKVILMIALIVVIGPSVCLAEGSKKSAEKALPAAQVQNPQIAEDKAVRSSAEAFVNAFNKADVKAVGALWTNDCEYIDETGRVFRGRDAIEKEYAAFFAANPGLKVETSISSVKVLAGNAAIEDGTSILKRADGVLVSRGAYTAVHLKEGDKWLMASVREYASPPLSVRPKLADLEWLIGDWSASKDAKRLEFSFRWIADKRFIELSYTARDKDTVSRSGIQIIGRDPASGNVVSWSFDSTGGYGHGQWTLLKKGLITESRGMLPDGAPTSSTDIASRPDADTLTWQSVNRSAAGQRLNDAELLTFKRKSR